eukprot:TRINITY_DN46595_c0_g1_i1.p1 TRINITY_DN46595_c0_g1~~TRINITY_DN46595_c0_g1_i1.p1  ORF type:complete len:290 (+),score=65.81 TRINITY_DN46595_c0_g1_i1:31-900(+)
MRTAAVILLHVLVVLAAVLTARAATRRGKNRLGLEFPHKDCASCYKKYQRCFRLGATADHHICRCTPAYIQCLERASPLCIDENDPENIKALCQTDLKHFKSYASLSCGEEACDGTIKGRREFVAQQIIDDDGDVGDLLSDDDTTDDDNLLSDDDATDDDNLLSDDDAASEAASEAASAADNDDVDLTNPFSDDDATDDDDFPGWAIALIIIAIVLLLLLAIAALLMSRKKKKRRMRMYQNRGGYYGNAGPAYPVAAPAPAPVYSQPYGDKMYYDNYGDYGYGAYDTYY